jgi:hypothetical protein
MLSRMIDEDLHHYTDKILPYLKQFKSLADICLLKYKGKHVVNIVLLQAHESSSSDFNEITSMMDKSCTYISTTKQDISFFEVKSLSIIYIIDI